MASTDHSTALLTPGPPVTLAFLHIPKTAGTSLTEALLNLRSWTHVLAHNGNIDTVALDAYQRLPALPERGSVLLHGHAGHGSFETLANALTMTVIRNPAEHAVSNYLHVRRDPDTPLHGHANTLPFDQFLRVIWQFIVFQSISLDVMVSTMPIHNVEEFHRRVVGLPALLERIDVVGVTDDLQVVVDTLARRFDVSSLPVSHHHRAEDFGVAEADRAALRARYHELAADPELAPLFRAERALYEAAQCRSATLLPPSPAPPMFGRLISRVPRFAVPKWRG